jgi:hypothetical protein
VIEQSPQSGQLLFADALATLQSAEHRRTYIEHRVSPTCMLERENMEQ